MTVPKPISTALMSSLLMCCGGDDSGMLDGSAQACVGVPACGGNLVGRWKLERVCLDDVSNVTLNCPTSTGTGVIDHASGTWVFNADGTYSGDYVYDGTMTLKVPIACVVTRDCANVRSSTTWQQTCVATSDTQCECKKQVKSEPKDKQKFTSYVVSGNRFDLTGVAEFDYCIQGNYLHLTRKAYAPDAIASGPEPIMRLTLVKQ